MQFKVTTERRLLAEPTAVWPLLLDSRLDRRPVCPVFALGAPRPVACRLPSGAGGVGTERECQASTGTIRQRITRWEPAQRLEFHMESTDLTAVRTVDGLDETFELELLADSTTRLRRTTTVTVHGWLGPAKAAAAYVGLKSVHRYVFSSWGRKARTL